MHMPRLTGLETLQLVRQINALLPCILVTADATEELIRQAFRARAYSVIPKPVSKNVVLYTVVRALVRVYGSPAGASRRRIRYDPSDCFNHRRSTHDMKVVPLNDKIVVKRLEAEEKTAGGIVLPDTAKEKPKQGKVLSLGDGKLLDNGKRARLPGQGRRPRPVHLLRRQRSHHRRRGVPDHDRGRHPRRGRRPARIGRGWNGPGLLPYPFSIPR